MCSRAEWIYKDPLGLTATGKSFEMWKGFKGKRTAGLCKLLYMSPTLTAMIPAGIELMHCFCLLLNRISAVK